MEKSRNKKLSFSSFEEQRSIQMQNLHPGQCFDSIDSYSISKRSSNVKNKTSIKNLLAEEMSKDSGTRKRNPGLIARLMGLDGLPAQPVEKAEPMTMDVNTSRSISSKFLREEQEFKDVFEVVESRVEGRNKSLSSKPSNIADNDVEFILKKYISAKQRSTDARLEDLKELSNVIEGLKNDPDLLRKFIDKRVKQLPTPESGFRESLSGSCNRTPRRTASTNDKNQSDFLSDLACPRHAAEHHRGSSSTSKKGYESNTLPTRIVILKPNFGRLQNVQSSEISSQGTDFLSITRKNSDSRVSMLTNRKEASQNSTKTRSNFPRNLPNYSGPNKGYAGDESSPNVSDNESFDESEPRTLGEDHRASLPSYSINSSMNRGAHKMLSKKYVNNHRNIDMEVGDESSILGEILTNPYKSGRKRYYDQRQRGIKNLSIWKDSMDIRSGRKTESSMVRSPSRSSPVLATSSRRKDPPRDTLHHEKLFILRETPSKERSKASKQSSISSLPRTKSYLEKPNSSRPSLGERIDGLKSGTENTSVSPNVESCLEIDPKVNLLEQSVSVSPPTDIITTESDSKEIQRSAETDQPSPVSVLDTSFPDEMSGGSECFGSLNADLQGLRMQLKLLKLESESYEEGYVDISSEEEIEHNPSTYFYNDELSEETNTQLNYMNEVLQRSGIDGSDSESFAASCHTMEFPVDPNIFKKMEERYSRNLTWPKCERKLLFDSMNVALSKIYTKYSDSYPWLNSPKNHLDWPKNGVLNELQKLFGQGDLCFSDSEAEWSYNGVEIDVVGSKIEKLLTDELLTELFSSW